MEVPSFVFFTISFLIFFFACSLAADSIRPLQSISDGKTLVSKEGNFELGFFSPAGSSKNINRYLGIWYKKFMPVRTVVWVANRCNPIKDSSGLLTINTTGSLVLRGHNKSVVWWTSSPKQPLQNPLVQILESGNLVLRDEKDGNSGPFLWQSFDYPCDTLLPEMKLGWDLRTGLKRVLSAWRNPEDPCPGNFTYGMELGPPTYPEEYIWNGTAKYYRTGPWNGLRFSGVPEMKSNDLYDFNFVNNDDEVYYTYTLKTSYAITRVVLNQTTGKRERSTWINTDKSWKIYSSLPEDKCDDYGLCGANANCSIIGQNPVCKCLKGFRPKSLESWNKKDWSQGCERNLPLSCQEKHKDGFVKSVGLKLPDTTNTWINNSMNLEACRAKCLNNCSCMAYVNSDLRGNGSGCVLWFRDLVDVKWLAAGGQDLYIRMPASELGTDLILYHLFNMYVCVCVSMHIYIHIYVLMCLCLLLLPLSSSNMSMLFITFLFQVNF